jgi:hypothetical protein
MKGSYRYRATERVGSVRVIDSSLLLSMFMSHKIYISAFHTVGGIIESQRGEAGPRSPGLQYTTC